MRTKNIKASCLLAGLLTACSGPASEKQYGSSEMWVADAIRSASLNRAIIVQRTLYPYHFEVDSAALNDLGLRDLLVLADYFEEHPGDINLHRGDAPFALYAARTASVLQELTAAGLEPDRVGVVESAPGGDGISSQRLVRILEKGEDGGAGLATGPMESMTEGAR